MESIPVASLLSEIQYFKPQISVFFVLYQKFYLLKIIIFSQLKTKSTDGLHSTNPDLPN